MNLTPGTRVGAYEIVGAIGSGGMGSVYRARDTRVGRDVAIKFSSERFTDRFSREARAIAALNHPNICHLYDVGENYLVMELVPGEQADGPFPLETALTYARQVAAALDAAHEKGIVHRDLKPANIRITPDGVVKVLDFGLAKTLNPLTDSEGTAVDDDEARTLTAATGVGVIVGTAAYMAPEQAQGKAVDKRADIWAFGAVLYEWITGDRAFQGDSFADTVAAILTRDPPWSGVPEPARTVLQRCLAKNPRERLRDIGDVGLVLDTAARQPDAAVPPGGIAWLPWSLSALLAAALVAAGSWTVAKRPVASASAGVTHWQVDDQAVAERGFAVSRDGRRIAYIKRADPQGRLWVRELNELDARPLVGTDNANRPFFSPDGEWLAYFTGQARAGHLHKVPVAGETFNTRGAVTTLCADANGYGGSWSEDGSIVYTGRTGLMRVKAEGGACAPISTAKPEEGDHRWPHLLPDGTHLLFTIGKEGAFDSAKIAVLDIASGAYTTVAEGGANGRYVPSGHVVFVRGGQMFAVPFDLRRLTAIGTPRPVVESVFQVSAGGFAAYGFSNTGLLVYANPPIQGFQWRDRDGGAQDISIAPGQYPYFKLSPDGTRLAVQQAGRGDIEVIPLAGGASQTVTSEGMNYTPIWSPDGRTVTFGTLGKGIFEASLDRSVTRRLLPEQQAPPSPSVWAPGKRTLLFVVGDPLGIWTAAIAADGSAGDPRALLVDPVVRYNDPDLSPDGRWLAYTMTVRGQQAQVYVRPYGTPGTAVLVSTDGGSFPRWSRDGRELFYLAAGRTVMGVDVRIAPAFRAGTPRVLLNDAGRFDVDPSGKRFVTAVRRPPQMHAVTSWFDELRRKAPIP
jgi:Tol biopolymer transport system component